MINNKLILFYLYLCIYMSIFVIKITCITKLSAYAKT
nr:MAG TPA: hypothetical protein [Crassvirales sp.]